MASVPEGREEDEDGWRALANKMFNTPLLSAQFGSPSLYIRAASGESEKRNEATFAECEHRLPQPLLKSGFPMAPHCFIFVQHTHKKAFLSSNTSPSQPPPLVGTVHSRAASFGNLVAITRWTVVGW